MPKLDKAKALLLEIQSEHQGITYYLNEKRKQNWDEDLKYIAERNAVLQHEIEVYPNYLAIPSEHHERYLRLKTNLKTITKECEEFHKRIKIHQKKINKQLEKVKNWPAEEASVITAEVEAIQMEIRLAKESQSFDFYAVGEDIEKTQTILEASDLLSTLQSLEHKAEALNKVTRQLEALAERIQKHDIPLHGAPDSPRAIRGRVTLQETAENIRDTQERVEGLANKLFRPQ